MGDKPGKAFIDAGQAESELIEADDEVIEEFAEAQRLGWPEPSPNVLTARAAGVAAGDVDARADDAGEEAVGGTAPTPGQDVVEELGEAVGLTYEDNEPLDTTKKVAERDRHRWELDPASSEDYNDRVNHEGE
jgi:hypothetical protein